MKLLRRMLHFVRNAENKADGMPRMGLAIDIIPEREGPEMTIRRILEVRDLLAKMIKGKYEFIVTYFDEQGRKRYLKCLLKTDSHIEDDIYYISIPAKEGSDEEFLGADDYEVSKIVLIDMSRPETCQRMNREGSFLPFTNPTLFDLDRYQVFTKVTENDERAFADNCFVHAVAMSGLVSDTELNSLRLSVSGEYTPTNKLNRLLATFSFAVKVHVYRGTTKHNTQTFGLKDADKKPKNDPPLVEMSLLGEHYIIHEVTKYTRMSLFRHDELTKPVPGRKASVVDRWWAVSARPLSRDGMKRSYRRSSKAKGVTSQFLLNFLLGNHAEAPTCRLTPFTHTEWNLVGKFSKDRELSTLEYNEDTDTKEVVFRNRGFKIDGTPKADFADVIFADFETSTDGENHQQYMISAYSTRRDKMMTFSDPATCTQDFLRWATMSLPSNGAPELLIYFHNLGYDLNFVYDAVTPLNIIKTGRMMKAFSAIFEKTTISFRDSYAVIPSKLADFTEMFGLGSLAKEVMPYDFYTVQHAQLSTEAYHRWTSGEEFEGIVPWSCGEVAARCLGEDDREQFLANCRTVFDGEDDTPFDYRAYAKFYCERDVDVMRRGMETYRQQIADLCYKAHDSERGSAPLNPHIPGAVARRESFVLDPYRYVSAPSLIDAYFTMRGCYKGVRALSNTPRAFIQRCLLGGRVMVAENKKHMLDPLTPTLPVPGIEPSKDYRAERDGRSMTAPLVDFDAVSLYPSAMSAMSNVPIGAPTVLTDEACRIAEEQIRVERTEPSLPLYVEIEVTKCRIHRSFPMIYERGLTAIRYDDRLVEEHLDGTKRGALDPLTMYVTDVSLRELIRLHDIDFTIVRGYSFAGYNDKLKTEMVRLFNWRLEMKREDNVFEQTIKLFMNSAYGITALKPIQYRHVFVENDKASAYKWRNYRHITTFEDGPRYTIFKVKKSIHAHFNRCHVAARILDNSKVIMNDVFLCADACGIPIHYQDTDSLHMPADAVELLKARYKATYGRDLVGKAMGQFHSDFELWDESGKKYDADHVMAIRSVFLGKKCYIDELRYIDPVTGEQHAGYDRAGKLHLYHIRMKGVSNRAILHRCEKLDIDPFELYVRMLNRQGFTFDLTAGGCPRFKQTSMFKIANMDSFKRDVRF